MARNARIVALAALLTAFGSGGSNAATLTKTVDCFRAVCSSVTGFDASLGTLQSVSFQGSVSDDAVFGLFNFSDEPATDVVTVSSNFQFNISKSGSSLNLTGSDLEEITVSLDPFESTIIVPRGSANVSGTTRDVAGFIGPDLLSFDLQSQIRASAQKFLSTGESVRRLGEAYYGRVIFEYAAVPEPASWVSLIAGFGLCGAALRRQRRTRGPRIPA